MEFTFSVNGTSGTVGYINFYVAKSLISNVNHLNVYLDGSKVPYTVETQGDCWLVSFTYHHSSHRVTIQLNGASSSVGNQGGYWIIVALVAPMVIAAVIVQLIFRPRKSKIAKDNRSANSRDL
jgi:hypothetical protein